MRPRGATVSPTSGTIGVREEPRRVVAALDGIDLVPLVRMDDARTRSLASLGVSYADLERRGVGLACPDLSHPQRRIRPLPSELTASFRG